MSNLLDEFQKDLNNWFDTCPMNFVTKEMAISPDDIGKKLYDHPIIAIGDANDTLWNDLKEPEAVGYIFKTPLEWMPDGKSVVAYFAPFTDFVIYGNCTDGIEVGNGWLYARIEGQAFLTETNHWIERWFKERGISALSPYASKEFDYVFEPGSSTTITDSHLSFTSNWSERHVAYVCGLGTFGLQKALITAKGVCGRFGSVITNVELPITKREYTEIYEYCLMCGECCKCPADAISLDKGKNHHICTSYFDTLRDKYAPRYGCGKCYVNVPCMKQKP